MLPRVVIQAETSLDGAISGFKVHMGTYYGISAQLGADADMFGSETMITADFGQREERPEDFVQPVAAPGDWRHVWFVPDSGARLAGRLHTYRNSEWCLDLVMLIAGQTPHSYREYLEARNYDYIVAGATRVDLRQALEEMHDRFGVRKVRVDSGGALNAVLLGQGLVDEVSILVAPALVGKDQPKLFRSLALPAEGLSLKLIRCETLDDDLVHLLYQVTGCTAETATAHEGAN